MGVFLIAIDAVLFFFFIAMVQAPLLDAQLVFPLRFFPEWMVELKNRYGREFDDYVYLDKPDPFIIGLVWVELLFQWPLALANLYGMLTRKSWFNSACLVYGASFFVTMFVSVADIVGTGKGSDKMLVLYCSLLGFSVLAMWRGLLPPSASTSTMAAKKKTI